MIYYKLHIADLPQIEFACSTSTDHYRNRFDHKGTLEITTVEGSGIDLTADGVTYHVPPRSVVVIMPDAVCEIAGTGGVVRDDTIAVRLKGHDWEPTDADGAPRDTDDDRVLLPMILSPGDDYTNITRLIRTFISCYMRGSAAAQCRCLSLWFELLACLDGAARRQMTGQIEDSFTPSAQMYVRKAKAYIDTHYAGHLRITDVAAELRITPNYLSNMFKQSTGRTVLDYIHMTRIQPVKELLTQPRPASLSEIAARTGLGSARNLCALFKRTCGVSVREYLRISKELTVYHERPWDAAE